MRYFVFISFLVFRLGMSHATEGFYISGYGGVCRMLDDISDTDLTLESGPVGSARIGYQCWFGLCFEAEGAYRRNRVSGVSVYGFPTNLTGEVEEWCTNLNALYCASAAGLNWFAGGGGGIEYQRAKLGGGVNSPIETVETNLISKFITGVGLPAGSCTEYGFAYEYVGIGDNLPSHLFMVYAKRFLF